MNGNHRRVARRAFGNITIRRRPDGTIRSYRAGYNAPTDGRRVVRDFPTRAKADEWLEREAALDAAHRAGITRWTHPSQRERADRNADATFHQWAGEWYRSRGRYDRHGNPLAPATLRVKDLAFQRLDRHFGRMRMKDITVRDVNRFLDRGLGSATADRNAYILLHRIMREAANPSDGSDPVIQRDPCVRATPDKSEPAPPIPPATPEQLEAIRNAMPVDAKQRIIQQPHPGLQAGGLLQPILTIRAARHRQLRVNVLPPDRPVRFGSVLQPRIRDRDDVHQPAHRHTSPPFDRAKARNERPSLNHSIRCRTSPTVYALSRTAISSGLHRSGRRKPGRSSSMARSKAMNAPRESPYPRSRARRANRMHVGHNKSTPTGDATPHRSQ